MWKDNNNFKTFQLENVHNWSDYRYTIDYAEDFKKVDKIISILYAKNCFGYTKDIINIIKENKDMQSKDKKFNFGQGWKK